ncbi:hypothetical protein [Rhizobium sp. CF080]|uniref:hypothetical protein n=1 Tax=Rhizobium sp. (strain CF080) TaxID=1144310 RepID=UPI0012DDB4A6|nr:hypothetical protein [Rhizobium sp. CF080]
MAKYLLALGLSFQLRQARACQAVDGKLVEILLAARPGHLLDDDCEYAGKNCDDCHNEH